MSKKYYEIHERWDEDAYQETGIEEAEYVQDYEEEDEEYYHGYSPVQGSWYMDEYEDEAYGQRKTRRMKIHSVKSYDEQRDRERKRNQRKIRSEAKAKEKKRQAYYHYTDDNEDE